MRERHYLTHLFVYLAYYTIQVPLIIHIMPLSGTKESYEWVPTYIDYLRV